MYDYQIITHRPGTEYSAPHFFILSKGNNSGRPMKDSCPNCFVCQTYSDEEATYLYWIAFFIFKNKSIFRLLRGSVIPFVSIHEYRKEFSVFIDKALSKKNAFKKNVEVLEKLQERKMNMKRNLSKLEDVMISISMLSI